MKRHPILAGCAVIIGILLVFVLAAVLFGPSSREGKGVILENREILRELERRRKNEDILAVVVRIDSPGGAVGPCQEIYSTLKRLDKKKPVIASMGAVAASGGYYIALGARKIVANPGTVTGSIGVIIEVSNIEGLMEWAKIQQEIIKSGPYKDIGSPFRKITSEERDKLQNLVDDMFDQFVSVVEKNRKMKKDEALKLADGSIYTGRQAFELGLVDELGPMEDAIMIAAAEAGMEGEPGVDYPPHPTLWRQLFGGEIKTFNGLIAWEGIRAMYLMRM